MFACDGPQNSAHWPRYSPTVFGVKNMWFSWPGTMSTLPLSWGIHSEWMTSAD